MRSKRLPSMSLVVALSATITACDADPGEKVVQRDVYAGPHAYEDCVADWGNEALCQQRLDEAEQKRLATAHSSGGGATNILIWGPGYSGGDRAVAYGGQTYTPTTTRAAQTGHFSSGNNYKLASFTAPKPAGVTPGFTSRGGFGATGRGLGGGGLS